MAAEKALLGVIDYVMFALMLLISAGIGIYFRFSGGKQKTTEEYLLAGKDMAILPVAFSLMASFLSAITVVGVPAEMYYFGIHMAYLNISYIIGMTISAYLTLPVFFEIQAQTAYEYIDRRFGKLARTLTSLAFVLQMILYMSVVLYAPALALSAVTNLSTWVSIVSVGIVCTFYCTLGGMKAVLWTDVFQSVLMFLGIFAVLIKGFVDIGFVDVFRITTEGGRMVVPGFDTSFYTRYTVWNIMMQGIVLSMSSFSANQVQVQRLLTVKNINRSRKALYVSYPLGVSFHLLNCLAGIVIYAYFAKCDPMTPPNNPIQKGDQLLPYFMMKSLSAYPGLPGLCICGIFSASLSTVSSAVNSLTAVTMQDLVKPFLLARGLSQKKMTFFAQVITLFFGFLCVALTFLVASFGNLVQASLTVFGMLGGPVLGIFLLGMLTRRANEKGVIIGLLTAIGIAAWIGFGASANAPPPKTLPISVEGCDILNSSLITSPFLHNATALPTVLLDSEKYENVDFINHTSAVKKEKNPEDIFALFRISYMWFAPIGFLVSYVVGYIASIIINLIEGETKEVPAELLSPAVKRFLVNTEEKKDKKEMKITSPMELKGIYNITNDCHDGSMTSKPKENGSGRY